MGCHSWFYQPWSEVSKDRKEEFYRELRKDLKIIKENYLEVLEEDYLDQNFYPLQREVCDLSRDEVNEKLLRTFPDKTLDQIQETLVKEFSDKKKQYSEALKKLEEITDWNLVEDPEVFQRASLSKAKFEKVNGETWFEAECHNAFRVINYPEDCFLDPEELISWLHRNQEDLHPYYYKLFGSDYIKITDLDEISERIRELWKKYNNKLYVNFG